MGEPVQIKNALSTQVNLQPNKLLFKSNFLLLSKHHNFVMLIEYAEQEGAVLSMKSY